MAFSFQRHHMMFAPDITNLPGQIEAALQFLRYTEEIKQPNSFGVASEAGRDLTKTEFEVKDSALTVLLEYFNQPLPATELKEITSPASSPGK
jgi:hypothetical protein